MRNTSGYTQDRQGVIRRRQPKPYRHKAERRIWKALRQAGERAEGVKGPRGR